MIPASCPTCGMSTNCPDEMAGRTVPCSGCGTTLTVGAPGGPAGGGLGGLGAYGGYGAAQQPAAAKSSGGSPWFFKWWVLALGGLAAIGAVAGIVMTVAPKPKPPAVAQEEPEKPDDKSAEKKPADEKEKKPEKPAPPKGLVIEPLDGIVLEAGNTTTVKVKVQRGKAAEGSIPLTVEGLPDGVMMEEVEIPEGEDSVEIVLMASEEAPASNEATKIKIIAEAGELKAEQEVALTIKPLPVPVLSTVASLLLKPGTTGMLEVKVDRKGYMEPIALRIEGLPDKVRARRAPSQDQSADAESNSEDAASDQPEEPASDEPVGEEPPPEEAFDDELTIPAEEASLKVALVIAADAAEGTSTPRITATVREQKLETSLKLTIERFSFRVRPLPVVTLKPGESKTIDVIVDRRSYTGPLKLQPAGLPEKVTAAAIDIAANETQAQLKVAAADDAPEQIKSAALAGKANDASVSEPLIVRVASEEGSFLPAEISKDSEFARLQRRGAFGGRVEAASKEILLKIYGGTEQSEAAVLKGLAWLAKQQREDGRFAFEEGATATDDAMCGQEPPADNMGSSVATTAIGVLPFLSAGITHDDAPSEPAVLKEYRPVVLKALGWIGQQQVNDRRDLKKDGELPGGMYAHALGTMALCEGYALSKDERMKIATQKAVKFLVQSPLVEKGWRSDSQQPASASVVAEAIMALRSAQAASMPVSKDTLTKAGAFLDSCAAGPEDARMSRYSHQPGESADLTATAAGLLCRQYLGWGRDETDLVAGCNYLLENLPPDIGTELGPIHYYFYATQVLHHREGEQWDKWNHSVREHLLRTQQKDGPQEGSWTPSDADSGKDGRIYATSMALLTLETYYRQLPLYKRTMKIADTK